MAVITRNDEGGKCIAFEFEVGGAIFSCRLLDAEEGKWIAFPVSLNEIGIQLQPVMFDVMGSNPTISRVEMTAMHNINKAYEDIIVTYVGITEQIRKEIGGECG